MTRVEEPAEEPAGESVQEPDHQAVGDVLAEPGAVCPACAEPASGGEWCEACGADLDGTADTALSTASSDPCVSCAAPSTDIAADGYCSNCGHKQPDIRDHLEDDQGWLVLVTDRGKRHHRNEDFGAVASSGDHAVLVVCDGVSTTDHPEQASFEATNAGVATLLDSTGFGDADAAAKAIHAAVNAAQSAVLHVPSIPGGKGSPSCTFVAALTTKTEAGLTTTIGWLGDSRAYWIEDDGSVQQLTTDHSWAYEQVADGLMSAEEANADRRAHTITRWLGEDAHELEPGVISHTAKSGRLLLCSDGLWNYADTDDAMAAQIAHQAADTPLGLAQNLVNFALDSGGHDNTTVALADYSATSTASPPTPSMDDQVANAAVRPQESPLPEQEQDASLD